LTAESIIRIIAAHPLELKGLRRRLEEKPFETKKGELFLGSTLIDITVCGVGKRDFEFEAKSPSEGQETPALLINTGFAGALREDIEPGSWVVCDRFYSGNRSSLPVGSDCCDLELMNKIFAHFSESGISFRIGGLATVDNSCSGRENRNTLFEKTGALAVDMEAYHLALVARRRGIPFLALKIVSDGVSDSAQEAIRARGGELSCCIGRVVCGLLVKLVSQDEDQCGYSNP
jgi:nucleoside phosphorylase